jgi:hypothetical protein
MLLVRKNKKILALLLLSSFSLFASRETDEIGFYYYTNNTQEVLEKTLSLLENSQDSLEKTKALYYLAKIDSFYKNIFIIQAESCEDVSLLAHANIIKKNVAEAKNFTLKAIEKIDQEMENIFDSRTWYNSKSLALHDLKLTKRVLQSELALFLIENNQKEEGMTFLKASKGKKSDKELKITLEKLSNSIKPPIKGKVGWTLEGFASLENAKEFFILRNYFAHINEQEESDL